MDTVFEIDFEDEAVGTDQAIIKVVGVGGAGGNALNNMMRNLLKGVDFMAVMGWIPQWSGDYSHGFFICVCANLTLVPWD